MEKELQDLLELQQERSELELKANVIPVLNKRQVQIFKKLSEIGFTNANLSKEESCAVISMRRELHVEIHKNKTFFNGSFISFHLQMDNHLIDKLSKENLEIVIKNIKEMFDTIFLQSTC